MDFAQIFDNHRESSVVENKERASPCWVIKIAPLNCGDIYNLTLLKMLGFVNLIRTIEDILFWNIISFQMDDFEIWHFLHIFLGSLYSISDLSAIFYQLRVQMKAEVLHSALNPSNLVSIRFISALILHRAFLVGGLRRGWHQGHFLDFLRVWERNDVRHTELQERLTQLLTPCQLYHHHVNVNFP